ncbi:hypothetical protein FXN63_15945 [Pigmentiphaga aceris]|uniref:Uncharacterized protein n=1 Tax=Pigmentiphaga aceris TaxID=1940612 RepID=A0A5C0AYB9_9BURK|nr:hypothetical protein [Pigmentiphaga aceris]QEI07165.1 hypothetical protein FXN63_15945 [Pigmentiphaga aceris]
MFKMLCMMSAVLVAAIPTVAGAASDAPEVSIMAVDKLPAGQADLKCDYPGLKQRISEKRKASGSSEYETMLSFAQRHEGDGYSRVMANESLRKLLVGDKEAAVFIFQDFSKVALVKFEQPANVNTFLKGGAACEKGSGGMCVPALFFDGQKTHCLLFTKRELEG